jgi:hypothetical protein
MKRSEMVTKLTEILNEYQYQDYYFYEEEVSDILKALESLGMQPPPNKAGAFDNSWEQE